MNGLDRLIVEYGSLILIIYVVIFFIWLFAMLSIGTIKNELKDLRRELKKADEVKAVLLDKLTDMNQEIVESNHRIEELIKINNTISDKNSRTPFDS